MVFPKTRLRRLRSSPFLRHGLPETNVLANHLIAPLFVRSGKKIRTPIASMPGHYQLSIDELSSEVEELLKRGIASVLLFGIPEKKDPKGSDAYSPKGIIQQATQSLKKQFPSLFVITDLCFCEYTNHGHCGIIKTSKKRDARSETAASIFPIAPQSQVGLGRGDVDNDATLKLIAKTARMQAEAGSDMIAPSGMMDGMVKTIRTSLDQHGFPALPILSYAAKFSSAFYGPFRDAAGSTPQFGDRQTYQMNPANRTEALREVEQDILEGADLVMVKPALAYLDIIREVKNRFSIPIVAYNVSGEYAMVKAAAQQGWIDEKKIVSEILLSMRRAGADFIITYHAKDYSAQFTVDRKQ